MDPLANLPTTIQSLPSSLMTSVPSPPPNEAVTATVTRECFQKFQLCTKQLEGRDKIHIQTRFADLKLWADSVGATAPDTASLDRRFQHRPEDIHFVSGLLSMLGELLEKCHTAARENLSLSDILTSIDSIVDSLAFIGVQIRRSGRKSRLHKADRSFDRNRAKYRNLRAHLSCVMVSRPTPEGRPTENCHSNDYFADLSFPPIQERLIEANLRRRHRFIEAQRHSQGLKDSFPMEGHSVVTGKHHTESASEKEHGGILAEHRKKAVVSQQKRTLTLPATSASGMDSRWGGLHTQRRPGSTITRITTITAAAIYPRAHAPSNLDQKLVQCPCCCQSIPTVELEDSLWRKHVATDLCPYTCVVENCPTPYRLFVTQQDWNDHILEDHQPHWQCPCCEGEPPKFERLSEITTHITSQHRLAAHEDLEDLLSGASIIMMGIKKCPLCDSEGPEDSPELIEHVLQHVHDFSLRSLPWPVDPVISLDKPVGTFDMNNVTKVSNNNESTECNLDVAEWAENTDHKYGVPKDDGHESGLEDDEVILNFLTLESEATPSLQLRGVEMNPPRATEEEGTSVQTHKDYFSQHNYFKEASSDGRFSSQSSQLSEKMTDRDDSGELLRTKQWICPLCSMSSTQGDEAYFLHLQSDHSSEMRQNLIYFNNDPEQWMLSMLSEAQWNGLEAFATASSDHATTPDQSPTPILHLVPEQSSLAGHSEVFNSDYNFTKHNKSLGMGVSFVFRIDEFTEHPQAIEQLDNSGRWYPMALPGYNIRQQGGVSGQWWYCDGTRIRHKSSWSPAEGEVPYKTFSTIYSHGHGLHILRGDATNPPQSETWHDLSFDWDETTLSSALTNTGASRSLRVHNPNSRWPSMLLPDIYHGPEYAGTHYGGLTGDLPILLALVALSMRPGRLSAQLPKMMVDGEWVEHTRSHGRTNKRGVIVYVYACEGNDELLMEYEDGALGNYFNN